MAALVATNFLSSLPARAQTAPDTSTEAQAMAVLQRAEKRLQSLQSLQAEWVRTEKWDASSTRPAEMRRGYYDFRLMKPLYWSVTQKHIRLQPQDTFTESSATQTGEFSDGNAAVNLGSDHAFSKGKVPPGNKALAGLAPVKGFFAGASGPATLFNNHRRLGDRATLIYVGKETWEGAEYDVVRMRFVPKQSLFEKTIVLYVGADDLIHRWIETPRAGNETYPVDEWRLQTVTVDPAFAASDFAIALPADATPYKAPASVLPLRVGSAAPDFQVVDKNGRPVHLSDYRGKVVVLDFWATWCGPCIASMPHMNALAKRLATKGAMFLAVNTSDPMPTFTKWVGKHPQFSSLRYVLNTAKDKSSTSYRYHIRYIPTQYVIDRNGKIAGYFVNADPVAGDLEKTIHALLPPGKN